MSRHDRRRAAAILRAKKRVQLKPIKAQAGTRMTFTCPVKITASDGQTTTPRRFEMVAYTGEPLLLEGFKLPVVIDIATADFTAQSVPALHQHSQGARDIVGQIDGIAPSTVNGLPGIVAGGYFTPTDEPGDAARVVMKKHDALFRWQASVGGNPGELEMISAGQKITLNGREYVGPFLIAKRFAFKEISFVVIGADGNTSIAATSKPSAKGSVMNFSTWLTAQGVEDESALSETLKANLKRLFAMEHPETPEEEEPEVAAAGETEEEETPPPPTNAAAKKPVIRAAGSVAADMRAEAAAELARQADLRKYIAATGISEITITANGVKSKVDFLQHAIAENWQRGQCAEVALAHVREERGTGPQVMAKGDTKTVQALQGAMILRAGGRLDHPAYKTRQGHAMLHRVAPWLLLDINASDRNRYMDAAHHYEQMSMMDICKESLRLNGVSAPRDREDVVRAAFSGGGNLTNIFTTNVNALLLSTFMEFQEDTTVGWVQENDVNDFKTNERPRVQIGEGLKLLPRNGEAEHTSFTDVVESYKVKRFARQIEIGEEDMYDDNFGVFKDMPSAFGKAAGRLRPDLVYADVILANPTLTATSVALFSDTNDNVQGSGTLAHATLSSGLAMMRLFRENSVNLNLKATHIIVPPTLEDLATELSMSSAIIAAVGNGTFAVRGQDNSLAKRGLSVVAEPRLENGCVSPTDGTSQSGSASTWFLVCANHPTIEVGYLKGTGRAPQVRTTVLDKGRWGINWDVKFDIGVKAMDWRGFVKST